MKTERGSRFLRRVTLAMIVGVLACGGSRAEEEKILWRQDQPNGLKIAFIGDQGPSTSEEEGGDKAPEVLQLIKDEGADVVVHQGDFDYDHDPEEWDGLISKVLGKDFPYFGSAGNHDEHIWEGYQKVLEDRAHRIALPWDGQMGVKSSLRYRGVFILLLAPDVFDTGHADYVREQLAADNSIWRIASWHKNQRPMQVGGKSSETGWDLYEECRLGGAIVATGHEHSYSRTHLLSDMARHTVASRSDTLHIARGKTFAFVNGMAGKSMRRARRLPIGDWWAKYYTTDNGANFGALFGTFGAGGKPNVAEFYFKDIDGRVVDRFTVVSHVRNEREAFVAAADAGEDDELKRLLASGVSVDSRNGSGRTGLMGALGGGKVETARLLLDAGASVTAVDNSGGTVLTHAATGGDVVDSMWVNRWPDLIRELVRGGVDVNARRNDGRSALMIAATEEHPSETIKILLGLGADTSLRDATGRTPLLAAAAEGNRPDLIALAGKSNVNAADLEGNSALMLAAYKAEVEEAVKVLIAAGADVNAANHEGRTVLMCAADGGSPEVVGQVLKAGAKVNARDHRGRTALMWAAHGRSAPTDNSQRAIIQALVKAGADKSARDNAGGTAVTWAGYDGNTKIVDLLK